MKAMVLFLLTFFLTGAGYACTTFAIPNAENNTVLIAKNRDEHPDLQSIVAFHPQQGYAYLALVSQQKPGSAYVIRSGINEQGLTIVNMAVDLKVGPTYSSPYDDGDDFMKAVLTQNASIASVLNTLGQLVAKYPGPEFYLLADRSQVAVIEIAPQGLYFVSASNAMPLYHTNNYEAPGFAKDNMLYYPDSVIRYQRIQTLMNSTAAFNLETFKTFSQDHIAGDNNSILRTGNPASDPSSVRTLATFIASIPKSPTLAPTVFIALYANYLEPNKSITLQLNPSFWTFSGTKVILSGS